MFRPGLVFRSKRYHPRVLLRQILVPSLQGGLSVGTGRKFGGEMINQRKEQVLDRPPLEPRCQGDDLIRLGRYAQTGLNPAFFDQCTRPFAMLQFNLLQDG